MSEIKVNSVVNSTGDNDSGLDLSTNDKIGMKIANNEVATIDTTGVVFNEGSADRDFRVESDGNTHALFLEGSTGNVGIGTSSISGKLNLATGAGTACELRLTSNNTGSGAGDRGRIAVHSARNDGTAYEAGKIEIDRSSGTEDKAHMLFATNGGSGVTERVRITDTGTGFGTSSPSAGLHLEGTADNLASQLKVTASGVVSQYIGGSSSEGLSIGHDSGSLPIVFKTGVSGGTGVTGSGTERMRIRGSDGRVLVGTTNNSPATTNTAGISFDGGNHVVQISRDGSTALELNRKTDDGVVCSLRQDGVIEGQISISGSNVTYGGFSGSHWSRLSDNSKPTIFQGTIIETIDEMCDWYQAQFTVAKTEDSPEFVNRISISLPSGKKVGDTISVTYEGVTYDNAIIIKENDIKHTKCKISDTADSKKVYGVYSSWDNDDDTVNDMYVASVGTYVVRINKDVTVQAGDLLSSNGDGTAKVQDDDIIRSKTIGKVLTNIKQETYSDESYTVPCALYCG